METNVLRIGNFVKLGRKKGYVKVYGIKQFDVGIEGIPNEINFYLCDDKYIYNAVSNEVVKPIRLNEEWLSKLPYDLKLLDIPEWIKYVHQLQNWYWINNKCKKELTFKSE